MDLVQTYIKNLNKIAIITNFLAFFQFLFEKFSLLDLGMRIHTDPDPQP